ncbi:hypothetical protein IE077_001849 [Cardiosporidium cionae]|uniref:Uncharacterized protein n=1 Tax=Cardiosporidium cionae TaxID=476202 RepID=A0ABQ7J418_9APIC|nr:hypothetical protein IE077_001849 [Cardiosporidium cionae]|eukprot:KAF8817766.1 hypothetical protein IE077_001849 [Cardiosporidium cionae]
MGLSSTPAFCATSADPLASSDGDSDLQVHLKLLFASVSHLKGLLLDEQETSSALLQELLNHKSVLSVFENLLNHYNPNLDRSLPTQCAPALLNVIERVHTALENRRQHLQGWEDDQTQTMGKDQRIHTFGKTNNEKGDTSSALNLSQYSGGDVKEEDSQSLLSNWGSDYLSRALIYDALQAYQLRKFNPQIALLQVKSNQKNLLLSLQVEDPGVLRELVDCLVDEQLDLLWCVQAILQIAADAQHPFYTVCNAFVHRLLSSGKLHENLWKTYIRLSDLKPPFHLTEDSPLSLVQYTLSEIRILLTLQNAVIACMCTLSKLPECEEYLIENIVTFSSRFMDDNFVGVLNIISQENREILSSTQLLHSAQELASSCILLLMGIYTIDALMTVSLIT